MPTDMTPEQKLRAVILLKAFELAHDAPPERLAADNLQAEWDEFDERDPDNLQDARSEIRGGTAETGLPTPYSRHYESKSVAAQMPDGSWVGWTYWYGGGKHGEPGAVEWIEDAYALTMTEEVKTVTVQTFAKAA
jgi:hypothetical protein